MSEKIPPKLLRVSITPSSEAQISKLWNAIAHLTEVSTDPCLGITSNGETGETELEGINYLHFEIYLTKLKTLGCEFSVGPYRLIPKERKSPSGIVEQQPIMKVEVQAPTAKQEVVSKFIAYHRGSQATIKDRNDETASSIIVLVSEIPLLELEHFPLELRSIDEQINFCYEFFEYRDISN